MVIYLWISPGICSSTQNRPGLSSASWTGSIFAGLRQNICYQGSEEVHVDHHPLVVVGAAVVPAHNYSPLDHGWITAAATWRRSWSRSPRPRPACWPRWPAPPPAPRPRATRTATAPCCCSLRTSHVNTVIMPLYVMLCYIFHSSSASPPDWE